MVAVAAQARQIKSPASCPASCRPCTRTGAAAADPRQPRRKRREFSPPARWSESTEGAPAIKCGWRWRTRVSAAPRTSWRGAGTVSSGRGADAGRHGGSGLGIAIVRRLVELPRRRRARRERGENRGSASATLRWPPSRAAHGRAGIAGARGADPGRTRGWGVENEISRTGADAPRWSRICSAAALACAATASTACAWRRSASPRSFPRFMLPGMSGGKWPPAPAGSGHASVPIIACPRVAPQEREFGAARRRERVCRQAVHAG